MIKFLLKKLFKTLIGDLTPQEKADFWFRFNKLMSDVTEATAKVAEATAKGAVEGMKK